MNSENLKRLRKLGKPAPLEWDIPGLVGSSIGALFGLGILYGVPILVGLAAWKYIVS